MQYNVRLAQKPVGIAAAIAGTGLLTGVLAPIEPELGLLNAGLLFLLLTLLISAAWGWEVGAFAAILTNVSLNFFFVEPLHRPTVSDPRNIVGLGVFLLVSVVAGSLLSAARHAAAEARRSERETHVMLQLSRAMTGQTDPAEALFTLCREVTTAFAAPGASVLGARGAAWTVLAHAGSGQSSRAADGEERAMAQQAATTRKTVRIGPTGLPGSRLIRIVRPVGLSKEATASRGIAFVPLQVGDEVLGILRLDGPTEKETLDRLPEPLLDAFAGEAALALQRLALAKAAAHAEALRQADEMKSALMASISHDLKTPLAGIKAAVSSLLETGLSWSADDTRLFLETIDSQAERLDGVISGILDLNRIESGVVTLNAREIKVIDLLEDARERAITMTNGRRVDVAAEPALSVFVDESLIAQALVNLVENAAKYSTPLGGIRLSAGASGSAVEITVEDDGPGIAARDLPHVFDRFFRAQEHSRVRGSGLGLSIVKGFVAFCGGSVRVESSAAGTRFIVTLPGAPRPAVTA